MQMVWLTGWVWVAFTGMTVGCSHYLAQSNATYLTTSIQSNMIKYLQALMKRLARYGGFTARLGLPLPADTLYTITHKTFGTTAI